MLCCRHPLLLVVLALVLAACTAPPDSGAHSQAAAPAATQPAVPVALAASPATPMSTPLPVAATGGPAAPAGCTREGAAHLIEGFFAAFNAGDQAQLGRFFGGRFHWYSVTEGDLEHGGRHFVAYHPRSGLLLGPFPPGSRVTVGQHELLLPYFAERHAHGERLQLRAVDGHADTARGLFHFVYTITREADDLPSDLGGPDHRASGKGAIDCLDQTIMVWSMAMTDDR